MFYQRSSYAPKFYFKTFWTPQNWLTIIQDRSKIYISMCCQVFWVVKLLFESKLWYAYSHFCSLKHSKSDCFSCQNTRVNFWVPIPCKDMCYLLCNANVVININYFQHKYVEVKSLRRSWRISNILLYKTLGVKIVIFFPNSL